MSTAEFTDEERDRILYFLGYPNWQVVAQSIQLGFPATSQPLFLVYESFRRIAPAARATARRVLCECERIERQISEAAGRAKATQLGELRLNRDEVAELERLLERWVERLADVLGVVPNPFSQREFRGGRGLNAQVMG